jgi:hypothetical protein
MKAPWAERMPRRTAGMMVMRDIDAIDSKDKMEDGEYVVVGNFDALAVKRDTSCALGTSHYRFA